MLLSSLCYQRYCPTASAIIRVAPESPVSSTNFGPRSDRSDWKPWGIVDLTMGHSASVATSSLRLLRSWSPQLSLPNSMFPWSRVRGPVVQQSRIHAEWLQSWGLNTSTHFGRRLAMWDFGLFLPIEGFGLFGDFIAFNYYSIFRI